MGYKEVTIQEELKDVLATGVKNLYRNKMVNRKGKTTYTQKFYTEVIIEYLYNNKIITDKKLNGIEIITREKNYYTKSHETLVIPENNKSNRKEEIYVKKLFIKNPFEAKIGKPVDYQVPLKKDSKSEYIGKIDLITYKEDTNELFLVEAKADNTTETAVKTILEIQTYSQIVNSDKLITNLRNSKGIKKDIEIKDNPKICKAIIVFDNETPPAKELKDKSRIQLQKLIDDFEIKECYEK